MWVNVPQRHVLALAWGPSRGPDGGAPHIYKSLYLVVYEHNAYQILIFYLIIRVWRGWMPILNLTVQEINFCHHKFPNYCFIFFYIDITISNAWYIEYWYRVEIFNIEQLYIWVYELCEQGGTTPKCLLGLRIRMASAFGWWLAHSDWYPNPVTESLICGVTWKGNSLNWLLCTSKDARPTDG